MATKVRIAICISNATRTYYPGEIVTIDDALAAKWITEGAATALTIAAVDGLQAVLDAKLETVTGDSRITATADNPNKDVELAVDITKLTPSSVIADGVTIGATAELVIVNHADAIAVALPKAAAGNAGKAYFIKNIGVGTATITPNTTDTIDGEANLALTTKDAAIIASNGSNGWHILASYVSA